MKYGKHCCPRAGRDGEDRTVSFDAFLHTKCLHLQTAGPDMLFPSRAAPSVPVVAVVVVFAVCSFFALTAPVAISPFFGMYVVPSLPIVLCCSQYHLYQENRHCT